MIELLTATFLTGALVACPPTPGSEARQSATRAPVELRVTESMDPEIVTFLREKRAAALDDPANAALHFDLGLAYEANTFFVEARDAYRNALALLPEGMDLRTRELKDAEWRFRLGVAQFQTGELLDSLASLRRAASVFRNTPVVQARLGDVLLRTGELDGAEAAWRQAIVAEEKGGGPYAASRVGLSQVLLEKGDVASALALAEEALELDPSLKPAHYQLGMCLMETGREEEAEIAFAAGVDASPTMPPDPHFQLLEGYAVGYQGRMRRVEEHLIARRIAPAIRTLEELQATRPDDPFVRSLMAKAYFLMGSSGLDKALELYAEAEALAPDRHVVRIEHAVCLINVSRFADAMRKADEAVELVPKSGSAHYFAGLSRFYEAGRLARSGGDAALVQRLKRDALAAFEQAVKHGAQEAQALLQVAQLLGEGGDLPSMLRYAEGYARREPANPTAHLSLCQIRMALFQAQPSAAHLDAAEAALARATKLGGNDARVKALAPQLRDALQRGRAWLESSNPR